MTKEKLKLMLAANGWVSLEDQPNNYENVEERLLRLALLLGVPKPSRSGNKIIDILQPRDATDAPRNSLSSQHAMGEFPFHTDTATWPMPSRYIALACASPGAGQRRTLLVDFDSLIFSNVELQLLRSSPFQVLNGRNSFFSTIQSRTQRFVRYDQGCMRPATESSKQALFLMKEKLNRADKLAVSWTPGTIVVIDNWRMLHSREGATMPDPDRKLLRITIQ